MKAMLVTRFAGPDGLELRQLPEPAANGDNVVVNVEAAGVNFADVRSALGLYPGAPPLPYIAGREFAGTVEGTGQRVMGYTQQNAFAEKIAISPNYLWAQPEGWNSIQASAFPVNYLTAWLVYWKAGVVPSASPRDPSPVKAGPVRVLIHAAAGGVGTAAVQLGRLLGFETFGTASSDEKLERLRALGFRPLMGADLIIVVFAVVVIGGMGSIMGSIITGFALGVIEGLTKYFYPEASNTVVFVLMVLVLLVKPTGLTGRAA